MSVFQVPTLIHHRRQARNGMTPASQLWRQLIYAENHITAYRHRPVYQRSWELGTSASSGGNNRFRFRTGYGVSQVNVLVLMGLTAAAGSIGAPSQETPTAEVALTISGGATVTAGPFNYGLRVSGTITDGPDEHMVMEDTVDVDEATAYEGLITCADFARLLAICVYELASPTVDEATNYMNTHSPIGGSPIYDADRERLLVGLSNMYRQNGGINAHWGLSDGSARTRSSATPANMIDGSTTGTPTTAHQGWYIDPRYHRTASRTTVPFEWAVYASMSSGTGTCRLIDTSGNTYGSISVNSATPQWWTATFNIPESAEIFLVPQLAGNGASTLSVYAASLIEWEA